MDSTIMYGIIPESINWAMNPPSRILEAEITCVKIVVGSFGLLLSVLLVTSERIRVES